MRERVDYARGRNEWVMAETGCRTIAIGEMSYLEVPYGELPEGKRWIQFGRTGESAEEAFEKSLEPSEEGVGVSSYQISLSAGPSGPQEYLDYLRGVSGEPEEVGAEEVRGVSTTRYRATLDVVPQMRADLTAQGWKQANIERYLEGVVPVEQLIDVWIDADGLVRRVETAWGNDEELALDAVTTTDYFDFGAPIDIEAPPPSEVLDGEEWQRLENAKMREELEEMSLTDQDSVALPGSFGAAESEAQPSCLH